MFLANLPIHMKKNRTKMFVHQGIGSNSFDLVNSSEKSTWHRTHNNSRYHRQLNGLCKCIMWLPLGLAAATVHLILHENFQYRLF